MSTEVRPTELLSHSFGDSLKEEVVGCLSDLVEVGLDSISEDGVFKDIPFISTAISIYRIGHSVHDRHNLKKLATFLDEINRGIQNENSRQKHIKRFQENKKSHDQELEFILVLIDRYIGYA